MAFGDRVKRAWREDDEIEHEFRPRAEESRDKITPIVFSVLIILALGAYLILN